MSVLSIKGSSPQCRQGGASGVKLLLIIVATMLVTVGLTFFIIRSYIFPAPLTPVTLNNKEAQQLEQKLTRLGWQAPASSQAQQGTQAKSSSEMNRYHDKTRQGHPDELTPQAYRELDADRQVRLTEKEVNAIIGRSADFSKRVAIDFSENLASATVLISIPKDFPIMAGEILRVNTGLDIHLDANRRPVVALVGVSVMGVPIPNAWLGNMKNINLVGEFGDRGFWTAFADGVEDIHIHDGELSIRLRK